VEALIALRSGILPGGRDIGCFGEFPWGEGEGIAEDDSVAVGRTEVHSEEVENVAERADRDVEIFGNLLTDLDALAGVASCDGSDSSPDNGRCKVHDLIGDLYCLPELVCRVGRAEIGQDVVDDNNVCVQGDKVVTLKEPGDDVSGADRSLNVKCFGW
jgi:hypothetical protein